MILDKINSSQDVKKLSNDELELLAAEIRKFLVEHISETGGHLAANLGVVELTLAIHKVFDVNYDRVIWDVGHQSYTHKILTGRKNLFSELRAFGGMSGFPKTEECEADSFNTGHSSTSISAAAGFAAAAKYKGENKCSVAVIGDGALTGGMAFEALNHAGAIKLPVIVILNDNGMSISQNVGGLSQWLKNIRNTNRYYDFKSNIKSALDKIPVVGSPIKQTATQVKRALKPLVVKNEFFEDFGFQYLGPVDGHNIDDLQVVLNHAKKLKGPVVIHVHTIKGKGYLPAEESPDLFHGIPKFNPKTGKPVSADTESWSSFLGNELCSLAEKDKRIIAITAAMPLGTGLSVFKEKYPDRFYDVGIAEQHAVTFAAGAAAAGLIPCFAVYSTFLQRGYDQLLHDVALQKLHAVFCIDRSGPVGSDGETHQGVFDISYISHLPGFTLLSPSNSTDFKKMLEYAFFKCTGPVAIRYPRGNIIHSERNMPDVNYHPKSELVKTGSDILIAAVGITVYDAVEVSEILKENGLGAAVLDVKTVKPIDIETIKKYASNKKLIVTIEDNVITGGFGQQIAALINKKTEIFAYPDEPIVQGKPEELKKKYGLTASQIAERLLSVLS